MTFIGYRASNHPQQLALHGPLQDVDDRATHPSLFDPLHARFAFRDELRACAQAYEGGAP
ncbi:MAG: hypothetical protein ACRD0W_20570 [Acidimicrobiales bacterium]